MGGILSHTLKVDDSTYLEFDVAVSSEIKKCDHYESQVDPEIVAKDDGESVLFSQRIIDLQCAPTRPPMWRISQTIYIGNMLESDTKETCA